MLAGAKPPISGQGRRAKARGPKGGSASEILGEGQPGVTGSAVSSTSEVRGGDPAAKKVFLHSRGTRWPLQELLVAKFEGGGMAPLPIPPKSASGNG